MSKVTVFVGVDYHQDVIQVCVMDPQGKVLTNRQVGNSAEEITAVVSPHGNDIHLALEACGGTAAPPEHARYFPAWSHCRRGASGRRRAAFWSLVRTASRKRYGPDRGVPIRAVDRRSAGAQTPPTRRTAKRYSGQRWRTIRTCT